MLPSLESLSLEQKIGQLFFVGISGPELDASARSLLSEVPAGGICLFSRNIRDGLGCRELLDALRGFLPTVPLLSVDQEGGRVDRLRRIMLPMPAAARLRNEEDARVLARIISESLRILGFNMNFAPVVDVIDKSRAANNNGLFSRGFGASSADVVRMAGTFLDVLQGNGIIGCLKHFPGLGASVVDSHEELPLVEIDDDTMRCVDLAPYVQIPDIRAVMVGHAAYPQSRLQETGESGKLLPASLSHKVVTGLLRDELGFQGLVITDDLEMGAIVRNFGIGEACVLALDAGCDMLAICADADAIRRGFAAVRSAVNEGRISDERIHRSLARIARIKRMLAPSPKFDLERLDELCHEITALEAKLSITPEEK